MKPARMLLLLSLCSPLSLAADPGRAAVVLPDIEPVKLRAAGSLGAGAKKENSGIVKSRLVEDLYWTQNDSGDESIVYPVHSDGSLWSSARYEGEPGVRIAGAANVDWEDIAVDDQGHLIVCDVGNNRNDRRDLALYYLDEPSPLAGRSTFKKKIFIRYPDQSSFPAPRSDFNFDCEGVFYARGKVYLISKNRSDAYGKLYRLDRYDIAATNELTYLDRFDFGGKTTGADATADGRRLAVVTYDALWVFETDGLSDRYFHGRIYWLPFDAPQVEAVCFESPDGLLLADEQAAELYRIALADMKRVDTLEFAPID